MTHHDGDEGPPLRQVYHEGLAAGEIRLQRCGSCGTVQRLLREGCGRCGHAPLEWAVCAGRGVVHAVTEVVRAPSRELQARAPYTLVLVDLEEGARVMACGWSGAAIDDGVDLSVEEVDGQPLIHARPRRG